ncbi:MAG: electron transport complex subunit RsxC [Candidatus Omnitrophica bacterium]|nr:electron transport complex subunit RsxC [Candidatus Omnitrophota bacterium]
MKIFTFPGGIHPEYCKDISIREPLREGALPHTAVIPLSQHIGAPNAAVVKKGDVVEEGALLGKSDSFVSSPVHSSISGKVIDVKKAFNPSIGPVESVFIERDETKEPKKYGERETAEVPPKELIEIVRSAGIVGMGGAAFPTHVKLTIPEGKKIETLIINGAECEPYLTCDHVLMIRNTQALLDSIDILIKILEPKKVYIAIEDNKKAAVFAFQKALKKSSNKCAPIAEIAVLKTKYPQGGEKQIIKAITGEEVPPGGLPLDIGFLVMNVGTVNAVYDAVRFRKPLIERIVTISGDCLYRPGNYLIRVGTTIKEIVENYGIELFKEPGKIIVGGPMMGFAQPSMDAPVLKSTSGILFLSGEGAQVFDEGPCVKCAKCVDVCPVRLIPTEIMKNVRAENWEDAEKLYVEDCIECGACAYSCPARIPLVHYIKEGKSFAMRKK